MCTVFSGNIDDYIRHLGTNILPFPATQAIVRPSGANIINIALNPSQYLYIIAIIINLHFTSLKNFIAVVAKKHQFSCLIYHFLKPILNSMFHVRFKHISLSLKSWQLYSIGLINFSNVTVIPHKKHFLVSSTNLLQHFQHSKI